LDLYIYNENQELFLHPAGWPAPNPAGERGRSGLPTRSDLPISLTISVH
jgi:hypothetical protein